MCSCVCHRPTDQSGKQTHNRTAAGTKWSCMWDDSLLSPNFTLTKMELANRGASAVWCSVNNPFPNVDRTEEIIIDLRKTRSHRPLSRNSSIAEAVLWKCTSHLDHKLLEHLHFLKWQKGKPHCVPQGHCRKHPEQLQLYLVPKKSLQQIVKTAGNIIKASPPSRQDIFLKCCIRKASCNASNALHSSLHTTTWQTLLQR